MKHIKPFNSYKINEMLLFDDSQRNVKKNFSEKAGLKTDQEIIDAIDNNFKDIETGYHGVKAVDLVSLTLHYLANKKDYNRLFKFIENMSDYFNFLLDDIIEKEDKRIVDWFFKNMKDRLFNYYMSDKSFSRYADITNADNTYIAIKFGYDVRDILKTWLDNKWEQGYLRLLNHFDKDYKEIFIIFDHLERIYVDKDIKDRKVKKARQKIIVDLQHLKISDKLLIKILDNYPFLYKSFTKANINTLVKDSYRRRDIIQNTL